MSDVFRKLKVWFKYARALLGVPADLVSLQKRFPTCHFYPGAAVDGRSSLGKFNVIFQNTTIFNSSLGDHSYVQKNSSLLNCRLGKFCSIAPNVNIGLGRHPVEQVSTHPAFFSSSQPLARTFSRTDRYDPFSPIVIGNDVWIGHSALIMDGVTIGNGAVVAANAVVTKNVAAYAIVAGVPARTIRFRFDDETILRLESLKWWDKSEKWLEANCQYFIAPQAILEATSDARPEDSGKASS